MVAGVYIYDAFPIVPLLPSLPIIIVKLDSSPSLIDAASLIKWLDISSSFLVRQHRNHLPLGACLLASSSLATCHRTVARLHHVWERSPLGQHRHRTRRHELD